MTRHKTQALNCPQNRLSDPILPQPLLPGINLARCFIERTRCLCECAECPPWPHSIEECRVHCHQFFDLTVPEGNPPY